MRRTVRRNKRSQRKSGSSESEYPSSLQITKENLYLAHDSHSYLVPENYTDEVWEILCRELGEVFEGE
jgi:hypothetical protein